MTVAISVVIPCYNGSAFVRDTLTSVVTQDRPPHEVLFIDDGSTDDSALIAASFGPPVRVLRQSNQGESVARNRGVAEARGTHVLFLDADDLLAPQSLQNLAAALDGRPNAVAIMGLAKFRDRPDAPETVHRPQERAFFPRIIETNLAPPHAWLTPIELVRRAGGFAEQLRWFEDWDLWWRVGLLEPELVPVDYIGALYRQHAGSQLATTKMIDRTWGHALLMARMAWAILERPALLERHGEKLFWSCCAAMVRARQHGVAGPKLEDLLSAMRELARRGPRSVRRSRLGLAMRVLGAKTALSMLRWSRNPLSV